MAHHPRHVLRQLRVEVRAAAPQAEPPPTAGPLLRPRLLGEGVLLIAAVTALLSTAHLRLLAGVPRPVLDIAHSVVARGDQALCKCGVLLVDIIFSQFMSK